MAEPLPPEPPVNPTAPPSGGALTPIVVSLPEVAELRAEIREVKSAVGALKPQSVWITAIVPILGAFIAASVGVFSLFWTVRMHRLAVAERSREQERQDIYAKINEFYGPFQKLRSASKYLYEQAFIPRRTPEEVAKYKGTSGRYRTILALADGYKFTGTDETLLQLIVELGGKTSRLIYEKLGIVNDRKLGALLAQATTHFRLMQIGLKDGAKLAGLEATSDRFAFPSELDGMISEKLAALEQRLKELQKTA